MSLREESQTMRRPPQFYLTRQECRAIEHAGGLGFTANGSCKQVPRLGRRLLPETKGELQRQYDEYKRTRVAPETARRYAEEALQRTLDLAHAVNPDANLRTAEMYRFDHGLQVGDVNCPFC